MSPEAWGFFTVLITTQAKTLVDLRTLKAKPPKKDPDIMARIEKKLDHKLDQHISNPMAHYEPKHGMR